MESDKIINGNCWVAYFDMLGFKRQVYLTEQNEFNNILYIYKKVLEEIDLKKPIRENLVEAKWFSDTFIFYSLNDSEKCMTNIEYIARSFFREMFLKNIPLRGCLNYGKFYANKEKGIYFGSALIEAYELAESQDWIGYILSEKAEDKMGIYNTQDCQPSGRDFREYYKEYDVPMKDSKKQRLPTYKISTYPLFGNDGSDPLGGCLTQMWSYVKHDKNLSSEKKQDIKRKYENTKNFLLELYPNQEKTLGYIGNN